MRRLDWRGWLARAFAPRTSDAEEFLSRYRRHRHKGPVSHPETGDLYTRADMVAAYHAGKRCTVGPDEGVAFAIRAAVLQSAKLNAGRHKRINVVLGEDGVSVCGYAGTHASALLVEWRQVFDRPASLNEAVARIDEVTNRVWRDSLDRSIGTVNDKWNETRR